MVVHNLIKPKILVSSILVIATFISIIYFAILRPSDSDIQTALSDIETLQKSTAITMPAALISLSTPVGITPEMTIRFKDRVDTYMNTLDSFDKSPAVQRNAPTKTAYNEHRQTLFAYGQQLTSLSKSLRIYGDILNTCDSMVASMVEADSESSINGSMTECENAIKNTQTSPSQVFNDGFLNEYTKKANELLVAYRQYFATADINDIDKLSASAALVEEAKENLGTSLYSQIDYKITSPPLEVFTELTKALNSQQKSFLR